MQIEMLTPETIEKKLSVYTTNLRDENMSIVFRENFTVFLWPDSKKSKDINKLL